MSRNRYSGRPDPEAWRNMYEDAIYEDEEDEEVLATTPAELSSINIAKKNLLLMQDVIYNYHPNFSVGSDFHKVGLIDPCSFNITRLVEQSLASVGGYTHIDAHGYDFSDFSDSKTATVAEYDCAMRINSVQNKIGAIRVTTYNPHNNSLAYFFLPHSVVKKYKEASGTTKNKTGKRLRVTWNKKDNHYNSFEYYRLNTFEELALAK